MNIELFEVFIDIDNLDRIEKVKNYLREKISKEDQDKVYKRFEFNGNILNIADCMSLGVSMAGKVNHG
jgi:hypothetical protein